MSSNDSTNRKRITVKPTTCPNPLFEKWLEEWREEAASRNSDLKYCFDKALLSLRKYPLKLKSGRECLILKNFGSQLCVKLDRKLTEYQKTTGNSDSLNTQNLHQNNQKNEAKKTNKRKKEAIEEPKSNDSAPSTPKKKNSYVPGWRSGPYAILITLYKEQMKPDYRGFLKKVELQQKAQELCDTSFVKPDPGSHYTAWSSMSTIVKKGLVLRQGNPAKFSLTKEGEGLAQQLYSDLNSNSAVSSTKITPVSPTSVSTKTNSKSITNISPFSNHYAICLSDDEIDFSSMPSVSGVKITSPVGKKLKTSPAKKTYPLSISDSDNESNSESPLLRSKSPQQTTPKKFKSPRKQVYLATISDSEDENLDKNQRLSPSSNDMDCIDLTDDKIEDIVSYSEAKQDHNSWFDELNFKTNTNSLDELSKPSSSSSSSCSTMKEYEQFIFLPGEFEIILLVDTQETTGKARHALSDDPVKELTKLGTKFEVRHLKVGDFAWISRHKDGKELVLPYIVERKRMDDLGGSIKDGRFHEQKFRLRQCGLRNVIYLVEKYSNEARLGLPINTIHQAAVNTQIVDNFHVKYTSNFQQSMMYLSVMSNLLSDMFKDKTLISCAKSNLPEFNVKDDISSLITFEEFAKISAKNKVLKVHEMFIKQLLQLKGLSVDRALAITERYPTPRRLIAAFKESSKPEMLLVNIPCGPLNRNIGPAISKAVYQLYCTRNFV